MQINDERYLEYVRILKRELIPVMGCTEPIAVAYAAALARKLLGKKPDRVSLAVSGNILKNVKSVIVPNTGGLKGLTAAVAAGIISGEASRELEVISQVSGEDKRRIAEFAASGHIQVGLAESDRILDIDISAFYRGEFARVRIADAHNHVVFMEKNGQIIKNELVSDKTEPFSDLNLLTIDSIIDFANICGLDGIKDTLQRQIDDNTAIVEEGLKNNWGANVGSILLAHNHTDVSIVAKARAAAGSDARMGGCELPVVINSGSGNQGITASVPVIEYARALRSDKETLFRALIVSNLVCIHQKTGLGKLSAFCGAVNAGCAAGAAIAYLHGGDKWLINHTIVNSLAITSGLICDGAKPSCAAKIAIAVEGGIMGYYMAKGSQQFRAGEGIVKKGVENTIMSMNRLGKIGMKETDKEIIRIMMEE